MRKILKTKYNKQKELTFHSLRNNSVDIWAELLFRQVQKQHKWVVQSVEKWHTDKAHTHDKHTKAKDLSEQLHVGEEIYKETQNVI